MSHTPCPVGSPVEVGPLGSRQPLIVYYWSAEECFIGRDPDGKIWHCPSTRTRLMNESELTMVWDPRDVRPLREDGWIARAGVFLDSLKQAPKLPPKTLRAGLLAALETMTEEEAHVVFDAIGQYVENGLDLEEIERTKARMDSAETLLDRVNGQVVKLAD